MSSSLFARKALVGWALALATVGAAWGQTHYMTNGVEYAIAGSLVGDQVHPRVAMGLTNGFLVWEDNATDGNGLGISARRIDGSFSGILSSFRVNQIATGDQERPQVALLKNGGAAFVWQGGKKGFQNIYARFLSPSNTWVGGDVLVNTYTNKSKLDPAIASLPDGNVIVVWSSFNQRATNSLQDVYGQRLSPSGQKLGSEFAINQYTAYNQRTPSVVSLGNSRFVVIWVSETQRSGPVDQHDPNHLYANTVSASIDVYGRLFGTNGSPAGSEFLVNTGSNACANPTVAADSDGGFMVAWSEKDIAVRQNGWDIWARHFSNAATGDATVRVNSFLYGDQYGASIQAIGTDYLVAWTSLAQDGSREGVFGQFLRSDGSPVGSELRMNTTTVSQQIHPMVTSDGSGRFLVAWSSFVGGGKGFDLNAQRYSTDSQPLGAPDAPFVTVLSSNALSITWSPVAGLDLATYQVFADGATTTPTASTTNIWWTLTGLAPASTHTFRLAYLLTNGRRSPLSAATTGRTYSGGATWGGIPQDWMVAFFGSDIFSWPSPYADSDGDGVSNLNEFLQGTNPTNSASVLRQRLDSTQQGPFLSWNTQPGLIYQVQVSTNMNSWSNLGSPWFAAGNNDSLYVGGSRVAYFRVLRVR